MARKPKLDLATAMARKQARDRVYAQRAAAAGLTLTDLVAMRRANARKAPAQRVREASVRAGREALVQPMWSPEKWQAYDKAHAPSLLEKVEGKVGKTLGKITDTAFDAHAKYNPVVRAGLAIPGADKVFDFTKRSVSGAANDLAYMPSGVYTIATTRPDKTINAIAHGMAAPFAHPIRTYRERPQDFAYTALALASGGASVAARGTAVRAALRTGRVPTTSSRAAEVAKAALRKPDYGSRLIYLRDPKTGALQSQLAMNFDSPLGRIIAKTTDRALGLDGRVPKQRQGRVLHPAKYESRSDAFPNPAFQTAKTRMATATTQFRGAVSGRSRAEQLAQRVYAAPPRGVSRSEGPLTPQITGPLTKQAAARAQFRRAIEERTAARQAYRQAEVQATARPRTREMVEQEIQQLETRQKRLVEGFMRSGSFDARAANVGDLGGREQVVAEVRRLRKKLERLRDPKKIAETNDALARHSAGLPGGSREERLFAAGASQLEQRLRTLAEQGSPEARAALREWDQLDQLKALRQQHSEAQSGFMGAEFPGWGETPARPQLVQAARPGLERAEARASASRRVLRQARSEVQSGRLASWASRVERTRSAADEARAQARAARDELRAARAELRATPETVTRERQVLVSPEERAQPFDLYRGVRPIRRHLAESKFKAERRQNERMLGNLDTPEGVPGGKRPPGEPFYRALRVVNRVNRGAVLYRPAYLPTNVISQEFMSLAHQGPKMVAHRAQAAMLRGTPTGKLFRLLGGKVEKLTPRQRQLLMAVSGSGRIFSTLPDYHTPPANWLGKGGRAVESWAERRDTQIAHGFGKIVDDPYRSAAFVAELKRLGVPKAEIGRTLELAQTGARIKLGKFEARQIPEAKDAVAAFDKVIVAMRRSNRAMIDYGRLSPNERFLRDLLFLYPWVKGAIQWSGRFPIERPNQTYAYGQLGNIGAQNTGLPDEIPSITKGAFAIGSRNVPHLGPAPIIVNPSTLTPFTQGPDTYNDLAPLLPWLTGHKFTEYHNPGETLLPIYGAALKSAGDPSKVWDEVKRSLPIANLVAEPAAHNPTNRLYPRTGWDQVTNFMVGSWVPKPYNTVRGTAIAREEQSAGLGKKQSDAQKAKYIQADLAQTAELFTGKKGYVDPVVAEGLKAWAKLREAERQVQGIAGFKRGSRLTPQGRLLAAVMASSGRKPSAADIKQVQAMSDEDARAWLRDLGDTELLKAQREMRARLREYNQVIVESGKPYTAGGRKIQVP